MSTAFLEEKSNTDVSTPFMEMKTNTDVSTSLMGSEKLNRCEHITDGKEKQYR